MKSHAAMSLLSVMLMLSPAKAQQHDQSSYPRLAQEYLIQAQQGQNNQNSLNYRYVQRDALDAYRAVLSGEPKGPAFWIGVHCQPSENTSMVFESDQGDELIEFTIDDGLRVISVLDESPADKAGLEADDVIFMIENQKIQTIPQMSKAVGSKKGDPVELIVVRDKKLRQFTVKPRKRIETGVPLSNIDGSLQRHMKLLQGQLPDHITITLKKKGSDPAEFEIEEDGGETYLVTLADVNEVPAAARPMVYRLGRQCRRPLAVRRLLVCMATGDLCPHQRRGCSRCGNSRETGADC